MNLKTATLVALIGVSIQFIWSLVIWLHVLRVQMPPPAAYWLRAIPSQLFYAGLIVFFVTLYRKQKSGHPSA
jgi:hypothetical protein